MLKYDSESVEEVYKPISIVIPCYEYMGYGVTYLKDNLYSIKKQSYPKDLIDVVISDNSTDDEVKHVVDYYSNFLNINYIRNRKRGVGNNTNNALDNAKHDLIKILYQDDYLYGVDSLLISVHGLSFGKWVIHAQYRYDEFKETFKLHIPEIPVWNKFAVHSNYIGMPSCIALHKCDIRMDSNLHTSVDLDYYQQLYNKFGNPVLCTTPNVVCRFGLLQASKSMRNTKNREKSYLMKKHY